MLYLLSRQQIALIPHDVKVCDNEWFLLLYIFFMLSVEQHKRKDNCEVLEAVWFDFKIFHPDLIIVSRPK